MVNHLPPQAYSKETLIQAYNWLRHQPPQVQELAKSPDVLVSLFSKAQMHGDAYMNRAHMQNFKSELKSLANMMGDFDPDEIAAQGGALGPSVQAGVQNMGNSVQMNTQSGSAPTGPSAANSQVPSTQMSGAANSQMPSAHSSGAANSPQVTHQLLVQQQNQLLQAQQQLVQMQQSQPPAVADVRSLLDPRSISMIQEVKNQFNLSSDSEALRLMIAIGYQKIRSDL